MKYNSSRHINNYTRLIFNSNNNKYKELLQEISLMNYITHQLLNSQIQFNKGII